MSTTNDWTPYEIDLLINLVREKTDLYDHSSPGYSNIHYIDNIWRSIQQNFPNKKEKQIKKKWQILRAGYRTRRNEKKLSTELGSKVSKKWAYFDSLAFLEPYITERSGIKEYCPRTNMLYVDDQDDSFLSEMEDDLINFKTEAEDPLSLATNLSDSNSILPTPNKSCNHLEESIITNSNKKYKIDERKTSNELFLSSLLEDMGQLHPEQLLEFKIETLKNLHEKLNSNKY